MPPTGASTLVAPWICGARRRRRVGRAKYAIQTTRARPALTLRPPPPFQVQILVRKVRNKAAGMIGETFLKYDRVNGCYSDVPANELS